MKQCLEGRIVPETFLQLALYTYRGKPISNSYLIHELEEAKQFEALGHNFSSEKLEGMSMDDRIRAMEEKSVVFTKNLWVHLQATKKQSLYLQSVANDKGNKLSRGSILRFNPFITIPDTDKIKAQDPSFQWESEEFDRAYQFIADLLKKEPLYAQIYIRMIKDGEIKRRIFFYEYKPFSI